MSTEEPGERVRALRIARGMTQKQFAALGGLRRTEISRVETGANKASSHATRSALARAFGLSIEDTDALLDGSLSVDEAMRRSASTAAA